MPPTYLNYRSTTSQSKPLPTPSPNNLRTYLPPFPVPNLPSTVYQPNPPPPPRHLATGYLSTPVYTSPPTYASPPSHRLPTFLTKLLYIALIFQKMARASTLRASPLMHLDALYLSTPNSTPTPHRLTPHALIAKQMLLRAIRPTLAVVFYCECFNFLDCGALSLLQSYLMDKLNGIVFDGRDCTCSQVSKS